MDFELMSFLDWNAYDIASRPVVLHDYKGQQQHVVSGEKGLQNKAGEYNCFINVVIQALWHLDSFRASFLRAAKYHSHPTGRDPKCVICALEVIFTQYEFSDDSNLPPTSLREAMALLFRDQARFQLREIDDAAEALEGLLGCLHDQICASSQQSLGLSTTDCSEPSCIAHDVFGITTVQQVHCSTCGANGQPQLSTQFTAIAYGAALRFAREANPGAPLCTLLKIASREDQRFCPNKPQCTTICPISHYLDSLPDVFAVSVCWESPEPSLADIDGILRCISLEIDLANVFDAREGLQYSSCYSCKYRLKGMILYYGQHYSAYFYNRKLSRWYVFDDATVKPVAPDWETVRERMLRGRMQPMVIFYESMLPDEHPAKIRKAQRSIDRYHVAIKRKNDAKALAEEQERLRLEAMFASVMPAPPVPPPPPVATPALVHSDTPVVVVPGLQVLPSLQVTSQLNPEAISEPPPAVAQASTDDTDLNYIRISKLSPTAVESQLKSSLSSSANGSADVGMVGSSASTTSSATTPALTPQANEADDDLAPSQFVFVMSESPTPFEADFLVYYPGWLRRHLVLFRLKDDTFERLPAKGTTPELVFDYSDVQNIFFWGPNYFQMRFKSGKEVQWVQSERAREMVDLMLERMRILSLPLPDVHWHDATAK